MRLGYFTMPVHPLSRNWAETLHEDREQIMLCDKLGFHDAFVGEHLTDGCETVTNSTLFLATLISDTKTIKLASGTTNLSQIHPVLDGRNQPIAEPTALDINTSIQRCLVKAIALHGLGLYVYAGEDLPDGETAKPTPPKAPVASITGNKLTPAQLRYVERLIDETFKQLEASRLR